MPVVSIDTVSIDVITTMIETGFDGAFQGFRTQSPQNTLWEQFTFQEQANGARNILQVWMEEIGAMEAWDSEKKFQDLVERRYKVGHSPWHAGVRMRLDELKERINQFGRGGRDGVGGFAADITSKLAHRASELDIVKVLDQLTNPTKLGYDGKALFADDHPDGGGQANQDTGGGGQYWYLMALGGLGRPVLRVDGGVNDGGGFQIKDHVSEETPGRFFQRLFHWSVEFDGGWFPGLWQTIYRSNQTLNGTNLDAAIQAMSSLKDSRSEQMGLVPTHILVGRSNHRAARELLRLSTVTNGGENVDRGIVDIIYSARLP